MLARSCGRPGSHCCQPRRHHLLAPITTICSHQQPLGVCMLQGFLVTSTETMRGRCVHAASSAAATAVDAAGHAARSRRRCCCCARTRMPPQVYSRALSQHLLVSRRTALSPSTLPTAACGAPAAGRRQRPLLPCRSCCASRGAPACSLPASLSFPRSRACCCAAADELSRRTRCGWAREQQHSKRRAPSASATRPCSQHGAALGSNTHAAARDQQ